MQQLQHHNIEKCYQKSEITYTFYTFIMSLVRSLLTYFTVLSSPTFGATATMATNLVGTHSSMLTRIFVALIYICGEIRNYLVCMTK